MGPVPFRSARLAMRPLAEADAALYIGLYTDPDTMRWIGPALSHDAARRAFALSRLRNASGAGPHVWRVDSRPTDESIGIVGLAWDGEGADIGVVLRASARGAGYGAEALSALADHAFATTDVRWLRARHHPGNHAVVGMMRSIRFLREAAGEGAPACWRRDRA